jgi:hypothetical protein
VDAAKRARWGDRCDAVIFLVALLAMALGVLATGWTWWFAFLAVGLGIGGLLAFVLRRRAGIPDRSLLGRLAARRDRSTGATPD